MKVVLTGGGTGGHIMPNLVIAEELSKYISKENLVYVGFRNGQEAELVPKAGYKFVGVNAGKLRRYFSLENMVDVFRTIGGIVKSWMVLRQIKPKVIFSKGGYASFPVCFAGKLLGIPMILHESDVVPGLGNKMLMGFAKEILLTHEKSREYFKGSKADISVVGIPVREEILHGNQEAGWTSSGLKPGKKVLMIMGGSQGAEAINLAVLGAMNELLKTFQIIIIAGKGKTEKFHSFATNDEVKIFEFVGNELKDYYQIADIIVTRGGATTLAEISALNKKALIVPLSKSASRGDQIDNAKEFCQVRSGVILNEEELNTESLLKKIKELDAISIKTVEKFVNPSIVISKKILEYENRI